MVRPKPRQVSQAPSGLLNENRFGVGSRTVKPQRAQSRAVEKRSLVPSWSGSTTAARPRPCRKACSSDSTRRLRCSAARTSRSCTTHAVSPGGGDSSSSSRATPSAEQHAGEPGAGQTVARVGPGQACRERHLEDDEGAGAWMRRQARRGGAFRAVAGHRGAAGTAVRHAHLGEEQLQVVVQLRHRADGGARRLHGTALVDRDGGQDAVDALDGGPLHAIEELPGVGGEALDVAPLPLGVQDVEGEAGLARSRDARDDRQPAEGDVDVDALEVVLARPDHGDDVGGGLARGRHGASGEV